MSETGLPAPLWQNLPSDPNEAASALLRSFLQGKKKSTILSYQAGLKVFSKFLGVESIEKAASLLFSQVHGAANKMALDFKAWLMEKGCSASTVNNRLSSLRSLSALGNRIGVVPWAIEVDNAKEEKYRDTSGPGLESVFKRIFELQAKATPMACRDAAVLALMGTMGFRRGEVVSIDLEDWKGSVLNVVGKGRTDKEPITIPEPVQKLLSDWLLHRGTIPGPLFYHFGKGQMHTERLSGRSVGRITHRLDLGHAHGLRHSAITEALDKNNGDVRKVARFSRHRNIQTLLKYDDNRRDLAGEVSGGLAAGLEKPPK